MEGPKPEHFANARGRMGYTPAIGSIDQDRIRHLTVALPPIYTASSAHRRPTPATPNQQIATETLKEVYFQDGDRRAGSLEGARFTYVGHQKSELRELARRAWAGLPLVLVLPKVGRPRKAGR
ncbi:hypothetical protein DEJ44_11390 [Streptomyces venezuelae]|nr:hypothetical protein DEJ44_11390 [Streptomyces venezuelae]